MQPRNINGLINTGTRNGTHKLTTNNGLRFGIWNVQTLYSIGALEKLLSEIEKYDLDILAIQEVKWTGEGYMNKNG